MGNMSYEESSSIQRQNALKHCTTLPVLPLESSAVEQLKYNTTIQALHDEPNKTIHTL